MDPLTDSDRQAHAIVETALRAFPVAEARRGFAARVVRSLPPRLFRERPRFRLTWVDYVISLCGASLMGLAFLINALLPPQAAAQLRVSGLLAWQFLRLQLRDVSDVMLLALLLGLAGLAIAAALFSRASAGKRRLLRVN